MGIVRETPHTRRVYVYFSLLTMLFFATAPEFLLDIPTTYILKNQLQATAPQVSLFRLLTGIPLYLCFLAGMGRDLWNPFGLRDRGIFLLLGPVAAAVCLWIALAPVSYWGLVAGMLLLYAAFRMIQAAFNGLMALVGQEQLMSGRLSAIFNVIGNAGIVVATLAAGPMVERMTPREIFLGAGVTAALFLPIGLWKPRAVFNHAYDNPLASGSTPMEDIRRLVKHKAIYPAMAINFLWYFNPGINTPAQFYLTERLHAPDSTYAYYFATFIAAMIPVNLFYGYLCTRVTAKRLLWWGTLIGVLQMVPLAFVRTADMALPMAALMGMLGGIATSAYYDLAVRSCPAGLQGTLMMLVMASTFAAMRWGDYLGAWIYTSDAENGIYYCVGATVVVYASILGVLPMIPKHVVDTADGQADPEATAAVISKIQAG